MGNNNERSIKIELTQKEVLYILHSLNMFMEKCENEMKSDPDGKEDLTFMCADDILNLHDIHNRIKIVATPIFGDHGLTVSYETL